MKRKKFKKHIKLPSGVTWKEVFLAIIENFFYGLVASITVIFIVKGLDVLIFLGYLANYMYVSRIVNRPKYVTFLGKWLIFPFSAAFGAYIGYKVAKLISMFLF